jgi:hypothetical protein
MPQQREQIGPDRVEHPWLTGGHRMQAIGLHQRRIQGHSIQQKRYPGHLLLPGQVGVQVGKAVSIAGPIVGRKPDAEQQNPGSGGPGQGNHVRKVVVNRLQRQAAQAVIGAQLQQYDGGVVHGEQVGQSFQAATAGLAADAGVDDLVLVPLVMKPLLQQRYPALLGLQPVRRTQAVTEAEDDLILRGRRALEPDEQ